MNASDLDMLTGHMNRALERVVTALDLLEGLPDDQEDLEDSHREFLEDLGVATGEDDWSPDDARERVQEDLDDVLSVTWEKGEPFDVALAIGGPNIWLVDFGGHGGAQLRGYWGASHVMTGPDVSRAVAYYKETFTELYGE